MGMTSCMLWCIVHCNCKMQMHDELHVVMQGTLKCKTQMHDELHVIMRGTLQMQNANAWRAACHNVWYTKMQNWSSTYCNLLAKG
jgi:hypothetical protein